MKPIELAFKYMDIFFSGQNFGRLYTIFAENLRFERPFYRYNSAESYSNSLKNDPPLGCRYKNLKAFESGSAVNMIYEFSRDDIHVNMSQLFEITDGKITEILLIFDSGKFAKLENGQTSVI